MSKYVFAAAVVLALSGCARPALQPTWSSSPATFRPYKVPEDTLQNLRKASLDRVDTLAASVTEHLKKNSKNSVIAEAKKAVAATMKDPGSTQFRNVRLVPYKKQQVVCGEVNAKNSYGGYVGFTPFVAGVGGAILKVSRADAYVVINRAANEGLIVACGLS